MTPSERSIMLSIAKECGGCVIRDDNGNEQRWVWDYAADKLVKAEAMPEGSARWHASEQARGNENPTLGTQ